MSQAHQGTTRNRASMTPHRPPRPPRRSAERATHSSCPIRGPAVAEAAGTASSSRSRRLSFSSTQTFLMSGLPSKPLWAEEHEEDQDHEHEQVGPARRDVALRERLREAEDQPAGHRTRDRADPADHGRREALQPGEEADRHVGRRPEREHHARRPRERRAEHEREHDHAVDVDAHHRRRLAIVGGRPHRLAHARPRHEQPEHDHQREGRGDDHDPKQRHAHVADVEAVEEERPAGEREGVVVALLGAEHQLHRVREEERDAERTDQRRDPRGVAERPVGEALDHDAEHRAAGHRRERDQHQQQPGRHLRIRRAAQQLERAEADERPDHEHVAVGEIEELQDPVDERVAERDQGVDAAQREAVDRELDEGVHGCRVSLFPCKRAARRYRRAARCVA